MYTDRGIKMWYINICMLPHDICPSLSDMSLSMTISKSIDVTANGIILLFFYGGVIFYG